MGRANKCAHSEFYTMNVSAYCSRCHEYLGFFAKGFTKFIKQTEDSIRCKELNKRYE